MGILVSFKQNVPSGRMVEILGGYKEAFMALQGVVPRYSVDVPFNTASKVMDELQNLPEVSSVYLEETSSVRKNYRRKSFDSNDKGITFRQKSSPKRGGL